MTMEEARDCLGACEDHDFAIKPMLEALPYYIETTTGMTIAQQKSVPLVDTVSRLLLQSWYYAGHDNIVKMNQLQPAIDSLLKAISVMTR